MNYQFWILSFNIFQFLLSTGVALYVWWTNRDKITSTRFKILEDRILVMELSGKATCCDHARMTETDQHITNRLEGISRVLSKIDGRLDGVNRMVDLLTQNELSGGK